MRLIQVVHGWPPEKLGGTGLYVDALSRALQQAGHELKIVAPGPPGLGGCSSVQTADLSGWALTQRPALSWAGGWRRSGGLRTWRRLLSSFRPDVVHVHHLSGLPLGLVRATQAMGIPVALTLHDYWIPCHRGQLMTPDLSRCTGPSPLGCARCTTGQISPGARSLARAADRIEAARDALEAADRLWSPSEALAQTVASMGLRRPELCPLPLVRAHPELSPAGAGPVRFLFAGSIIPTKAPHLALEAFAGLSGEATLSLAGPRSRLRWQRSLWTRDRSAGGKHQKNTMAGHSFARPHEPGHGRARCAGPALDMAGEQPAGRPRGHRQRTPGDRPRGWRHPRALPRRSIDRRRRCSRAPRRHAGRGHAGPRPQPSPALAEPRSPRGLAAGPLSISRRCKERGLGLE